MVWGDILKFFHGLYLSARIQITFFNLAEMSIIENSVMPRDENCCCANSRVAAVECQALKIQVVFQVGYV